MNIQDVNSLIADFVQVGYMEAVKSYEPCKDSIRKIEVKSWLKMMKMDLKKFDALTKIGIIKPFRKGEAKNSPLYYSKKEIKQAFSMANICSMIAKDNLSNSLKK